jgi:hypothetical protein
MYTYICMYVNMYIYMFIYIFIYMYIYICINKYIQDSDFYGSTLRLCLIGFLRSEQKFNSFDALVAQINADIQQSRDLCKNLDNSGPLRIGKEIATDFFLRPIDRSPYGNSSLVWERISSINYCIEKNIQI